MISLSKARREADEFARALDEPDFVDGAPYADLVGTVALLRAERQPLPRPEFVSDLRERLMAAADEAIAPTTAPTSLPVRTVAPMHPHRRRLATLAAGLTIVGGTAGVAAAAQGTLPGDSLYPVKRGLETLQLHLATSDSARGRDLLGQASTRLEEAKALLSESTDSRNVSLASEALDAATTSANDGANLLFDNYQSSRSTSDVTAVRSFAADQMDTVGQIAKMAPAVSPVVSQLGDALAAIDQKARSLCLTCLDGSPAVSLPESILTIPSDALKLLVAQPTQRAGALESLAEKAEKVAQTQPSTPPPTMAPPAGPSTPTSPDKQTTSTTQKGQQPAIGQLITGLTGAANGLPGQLVDTVNGVVNGLGSTVSQVTNGLGQALGGLIGGTSTTTPSDLGK